MKKRDRVLALVLAAVMILGSVQSVGAYYAPGSEATGGLNARELSKEVAKEGMVLLENKEVGGTGEKALPLAPGETVAIFGINQIDYVHGGGGSGNFTSEYYRSLWYGMSGKATAGKIQLYSGLYAKYKNYFDTHNDQSYAYGTKQGAVIMFYGEMELTADDVTAAAAAADTAIYAIGRPAGEDADRSSGKGDFRLSDKEMAVLGQIKAAGFKKVVVVLNVAGVMDTSWLKDDPDIDAALMVYFPGMEGGIAIADVLCGDAYPSGKLVDTWAKNYADYPSANNFGNSGYAKYEEDIFVGYRYFETIPGAAEKVNYEFGYGLSYADFTISDVAVTVTGTGRSREVNVSAKVTNNSAKYAGKEVVQVYYGAPEGQLPQAKKELAAFVKTPELAPGQSTDVSLRFPFDDMASYDDVGKTGNKAAYVLEVGTYPFYVGNSVKNATNFGSFSLSVLEVVEQLANRLVPDTAKLTRRLTAEGTYESLTQTAAAPPTPEPEMNPVFKETDIPFVKFTDVVKDPALLTTFVHRMTDGDLAFLVSCQTPASSWHRTGIGGLKPYGVPLIGTANGPAGIQYNGGSATNPERNTTFFPSATMQASTWNVELIQQVGASMGAEARHFGMSLWQAPGMNLHRNPLCGRNFEYFSEDPLITGKMGAYITKGVQSQKFASQLKHFALNNQENGRWGNDSQVSERAMREIYLKGFEITVRESDPWSIMSSYNRINGVYASESYELLTEILRGEWGFDGFVMTDFRTTPSHVGELRGGGDLKAPQDSGQPEQVQMALKNGTLQRWQAERSAVRILEFILKTEDVEKLDLDKFTYVVSLGVNRPDVIVDNSTRKILLLAGMTCKEFMDAIENPYNQTYTLFDGAGEEVTQEKLSGAVKSDMKLVVTAEDGVTAATYTFSITTSLALMKPAKASYVEGSYYASNAVDGLETSRWSAYNANESNRYGHWIEVDLGDDYDIFQIASQHYNGASRTYNYEIWVKAEADDHWTDTAKNRDFPGQGYTRVLTSSSNRVAKKVDNLPTGIRARYLVMKVTGGANGATTGTLWELEVFGWKLKSELYAIDPVNRTVAIPENELFTTVSANLTVVGDATMEIAANAAWVGETITVTDGNGNETVYRVVKPVTDIALDKSSMTLRVGSSETVTATVLPEDAYNKDIAWRSGDESVATVAGGVVTAVGEGTTVITATAPGAVGVSASLTVTVKPDRVVGRIETAAASDVAGPIEYIISLDGMERVLNARIYFEVDGNMLAGQGLEVLLSEFTALDAGGGTVRWTPKEDGIWEGEFLLMYLGGGEGYTSDSVENIAKMVYTAKQLGDATMRLTRLVVSGLDEDGLGITLDSEIRIAEATTSIMKVYSKYDLNKDGVIDQRDLAMAQRYYMAKMGDANWEAASACDFVVDGVVDMLDLLDLFLHFDR